MIRKINATWHKANRMPMRSSLDQRVTWHLAHLAACGCRADLPPTIVAELKRRGTKVAKEALNEQESPDPGRMARRLAPVVRGVSVRSRAASH